MAIMTGEKAAGKQAQCGDVISHSLLPLPRSPAWLQCFRSPWTVWQRGSRQGFFISRSVTLQTGREQSSQWWRPWLAGDSKCDLAEPSRAGEMTQWVRVHCSCKAPNLGPSTQIRQVTIACNHTSRGLDALGLPAPTHTHTHTDTHGYIMKDKSPGAVTMGQLLLLTDTFNS